MITFDFDKLPLTPGSRVLDAGCGGGRHLSEAFRHHDVDVVGIDMCQQDLVKARNTLRVMHREGEDGGGDGLVTRSDITHLPFADGSFDIVICSEVLEHIPAHLTAINEIVRVLKTGGFLVVSVPRYLPERLCWALSEAYHNEQGGHIRIFHRRDLIRKLETAGTRLTERGWAHALHSPYWWIRCLVGHHNEEHWAVKTYHRFLVWDIMKKPWLTRTLDRLLNPFISKSVVLYLEKGGQYET